MGLEAITQKESVLKAIREFDALGRKAFLDKYQFGEAKDWFLVLDGQRYDTKPILGAAHGFEKGVPLRFNEFTGGPPTIKKLEELGFVVEKASDAQIEPKRRYWAGGHLFGDESQLDEFLSEKTWRIGWPRDSKKKGAVGAWRRFANIQPGDLFAIKGYGGTNDLQVHAVGQVESVDAEAGSLRWQQWSVPLFRAKAPGGPGDGTWFETLSEVKAAGPLKEIFGVSGTGPSPEAPATSAARSHIH